VGLVCLGLDRPDSQDETEGLAGSAVLAGSEDGSVAQAWWWELAGPAECLAGRGGEFRSVGACLVAHCLVVEFRADHCLVVEFPVGHCLVGACLVVRWVGDSLGCWQVDDSRGYWQVGDSRVDRRRAGDSLGFRNNARADDKSAFGWDRVGGSLVGDSASCRRIRDSRRSRVVAGDTRRWVAYSRRPRLLPMDRGCSRRRGPIPIPSLPIPKAGCWLSTHR